MIVYMNLENLLKEKNISKNKLCEACNLQRTQLNNYCKNKVTRIDFTILAKLCEFLDCTPNDILKLKQSIGFLQCSFSCLPISSKSLHQQFIWCYSEYSLIFMTVPFVGTYFYYGSFKNYCIKFSCPGHGLPHQIFSVYVYICMSANIFLTLYALPNFLATIIFETA